MNKPNLMYWVDCKNRLSNVKLCLIICKSVLLHEHCHKIAWRNINCELILIHWNCGFHDCLTVPFFFNIGFIINFIKFNDFYWDALSNEFELVSSIRGGKWARWITLPLPYPIQQKKSYFLLINVVDLSLQLLPKITEVHQGEQN